MFSANLLAPGRSRQRLWLFARALSQKKAPANRAVSDSNSQRSPAAGHQIQVDLEECLCHLESPIECYSMDLCMGIEEDFVHLKPNSVLSGLLIAIQEGKATKVTCMKQKVGMSERQAEVFQIKD